MSSPLQSLPSASVTRTSAPTAVAIATADPGFHARCRALLPAGCRLLDPGMEIEQLDLVLLDAAWSGTHGARTAVAEASEVLVIGAGDQLARARAALARSCTTVAIPISDPELGGEIDRALNRAAADRELRTLRALVAEPAEGLVVGRAQTTRTLREHLLREAGGDAPIVVLGDPGSGRTHVAKALHLLSPRRARPCVVIRCGDGPEVSLWRALFGREADGGPGALRAAHLGTLVLDDLDRLGEAAAERLLRRIAEEPQCDARVVITARGTTAGESDDGSRFAQRTVPARPLVVPRLRDRRSDIPLLVTHLRGRIAREIGVAPPPPSPEALLSLIAHDWPANVRELEECLVMAATLGVEPVPGLSRRGLAIADPGCATPATSVQPVAPPDRAEAPEGATLAEVERRHILRVLDQVGGHRGQAAERLGIDRRTLYRKLREFGVGSVRLAD